MPEHRASETRPSVANPSDHEAEVRAVVEAWARAIRDADLEGVLAHHPADIVLYDVPPPLELRGIAAYQQAWELFVSLQGKGAFNLEALSVTAGDDVAFCHSIVTCGTRDPAGQFQVRLTLGLRKIDGQWIITHEHHSVPAEASANEA